jgi:hypothetical protein
LPILVSEKPASSFAPSETHGAEPGRHFCTPFHAHELKMFLNFLKTFTCALSIILHLCIKFQIQITSNEEAVKKDNLI